MRHAEDWASSLTLNLLPAAFLFFNNILREKELLKQLVHKITQDHVTQEPILLGFMLRAKPHGSHQPVINEAHLAATRRVVSSLNVVTSSLFKNIGGQRC